MGEVMDQNTPQQQQSLQSYKFSFLGDGTSYALVFFKTLLLTIVTLFLYRPWAKTERRKYIIGHCTFNMERLNFHGNGMEIFKAYIVIAICFMLIMGLFAALPESLGNILSMALTLGLWLVLIPYATIALYRYLLSRTSWRGIRLGMKSVHWQYVGCWIKGIFLTPLTLGLYYPFWTNELFRISANAIKFGNIGFHYTGSGKDVFGIFLKHFFAFVGLVILIGTLIGLVASGTLSQGGSIEFLLFSIGLLGFLVYMGILASYTASVFGYRMSKTWMGSETLGAARGRFNLGAMDILRIQAVFFCMVVFTFGIGLPWASVYVLSNLLPSVEFEGHVDMDRVNQGYEGGHALSDGAADALDLGGSLGI